ncbi:hypothetical protein [Vibrio sp. 10N.261.51.F12]|uniref:hypothetical protein n=1 Tax=Vibrio sp. 10N.261.51.F12 TaxID=3229679 RepID=UPI0035538092
MNNFKWNAFGVLTRVEKTDTMVFIENSAGNVRKMSVKRYKDTADVVYEKAQNLLGQSVTIRTSQNTNNWSVDEWFSEIAPI